MVLGALLVVLGERAQFDMRTVPQLGAAAPPCTPAHEARESQGARAPAKRKSAVRALALAVAVQGLVQKYTRPRTTVSRIWALPLYLRDLLSHYIAFKCVFGAV